MKLTDYPPTVRGFADIMLRQYGPFLKYAKDTGTFYTYDGVRWVPNDKRATEVRGLVGKIDAIVYKRWMDAPAGDKNGDVQAQRLFYQRQALLKLYQLAAADNGIKSVLAVMADSKEIQCESDDFVKREYLLNFKNGTLDLTLPYYDQEDGQPGANFVKHDPAHMLATVLETPYAEIYDDDQARAPKWQQLLLRACDGDRSLAESLEEALAYGLYGTNPEQVAVFLVGAPATGKTQIVEIVRSLAGSLGTTAETALIRKTYSEDHDKIKSVLRGKRFVTIDETDAHMRLDSTKIKQVSGAKYTQTRLLNREPMDTRVTWTLYVATNDLPEIAGSMDGGVERRLWMFPMSENSIPENERNINIREEIIREEGPVIMWRLARKLSEWYARKEEDPGVAIRMHARSIAMRDEYKASSNTVQEFATARLREEEGTFLDHGEAFEAYIDFCKKNRYSPEDKRKFTKLVRSTYMTDSDKHSRFRNIAMSYEASAWNS